MTRGIRGLTFDAFGTILDTGRGVLVDVATRIVEDYRLPISGERFLERWDAHFFAEDHGAFLTLAEASAASLAKAFTDFHVDGDPDPYVDVLEAEWRRAQPYPEVPQVLAALQGIPRAVVSNADDALLKEILTRNRLTFDAVVTSEACRAYKPAARIFEVALEGLGMDAADVLHVGDSLEADIDGARRLGIRTAWVNRTGDLRRGHQPAPDFEVRDLSAIPEILRPEGEGGLH